MDPEINVTLKSKTINITTDSYSVNWSKGVY